MARKGAVQEMNHNHKTATRGKLSLSELFVDVSITIPTTLIIWRTYGLRKMFPFVVGLTVALVTKRAFISAMIRKIGPEQTTLADILTLSRAAIGGVLAGIVSSNIRDRKGVAGWIAFLMPLLGATATDWLDGPLARYAGPTRLGGILDIEADSWLTFWTAACAITLGDLPIWCLLPPVLRYLDPLHALLHSKLPQGGGPWLSRVTGTSQMVLFFIALTPFDFQRRKQLLTVIALPISSAQCITILVLLLKKLREN